MNNCNFLRVNMVISKDETTTIINKTSSMMIKNENRLR